MEYQPVAFHQAAPRMTLLKATLPSSQATQIESGAAQAALCISSLNPRTLSRATRQNIPTGMQPLVVLTSWEESWPLRDDAHRNR